MSKSIFPATAMTFAVSVTSTASTGKALGSTPNAGMNIRLVNEGPHRCYVHLGGSGAVATVPDTTDAFTTCTPVLAGEDVILSISPSQTYISAITRSSETATLIVAVAEGA